MAYDESGHQCFIDCGLGENRIVRKRGMQFENADCIFQSLERFDWFDSGNAEKLLTKEIKKRAISTIFFWHDS